MISKHRTDTTGFEVNLTVLYANAKPCEQTGCSVLGHLFSYDQT